MVDHPRHQPQAEDEHHQENQQWRPLRCGRLLPDIEVRAKFQVLNHLPTRRIDPQYAELSQPNERCPAGADLGLALAYKMEQNPNQPGATAVATVSTTNGLWNIACFVSGVHAPTLYHAPARANHAAPNV